MPSYSLARFVHFLRSLLLFDGNFRIGTQRDAVQAVTDAFETKADLEVPKTILGKTMLEEIHADMAKTHLPSWIGRAPPNFGNPGHGKLTADQWRTLCTIHLPVTLTRVWSKPSATEKQAAMLENYLDLVTAVLWGTPRRLTENRIRVYDKYIFKYAKGLRTIFGVDLTPNQHYALHLGSILRRFGPTHSYWSFPFERYIGLLRQIRTNQKSSKSLRDLFVPKR